MIARDLISEDIVSLKTSNTGDDALALMSEYHVHNFLFGYQAK